MSKRLRLFVGPWLATCAVHRRASAVIAVCAALALTGGLLVGVHDDQLTPRVTGQITAPSTASSPQQRVTSHRPAPVSIADLPAAQALLYRRAARATSVDWRLLAAIGNQETDHGRSSLPGVRSQTNAFGAAGPMQFCVLASCGNTWSAFATDGDGDGVANVYSEADAIYGAARLVRYLRQQLGDDPALLAAAYNAGLGSVLSAGGVPPIAQTQIYVREVLAYRARLPA